MRTLALISTASALLHSQAPLRSSTPLSAIDITNRGYVRIDTEKETVAHPKAAPVLDEVSLRKCVDEAVQDADWHRPISVLGSTGSIGTQTLDFCRARPDRFSVIALCAGANYQLLATQVAEFRRTVTTVGISDGSKLEPLKEALKAAAVATWCAGTFQRPLHRGRRGRCVLGFGRAERRDQIVRRPRQRY